MNISIISAAPLDAGQVKSISEKYGRLYSAAAVKTEVKLDTGLVGGVRVVIGDKMTDVSVKGRLKDLQRLLLK